MGMIETVTEYEFIYRAISESIMDGNTEVMARNFFTHIQQLDEIHPTSGDVSSTVGAKSKILCSGGYGVTGFQMEFRKITATAPVLKPQGRGGGNTSQMIHSGPINPNGIRYTDFADEALSAVSKTRSFT